MRRLFVFRLRSGASEPDKPFKSDSSRRGLLLQRINLPLLREDRLVQVTQSAFEMRVERFELDDPGSQATFRVGRLLVHGAFLRRHAAGEKDGTFDAAPPSALHRQAAQLHGIGPWIANDVNSADDPGKGRPGSYETSRQRHARGSLLGIVV